MITLYNPFCSLDNVNELKCSINAFHLIYKASKITVFFVTHHPSFKLLSKGFQHSTFETLLHSFHEELYRSNILITIPLVQYTVTSEIINRVSDYCKP